MTRIIPLPEMKTDIPYELDIARYDGPKKPCPPEDLIKFCVLPLAELAKTAISLNRANEMDFNFLKRVTNNGPEFNGYNTMISREAGHSLASKTKAV